MDVPEIDPTFEPQSRARSNTWPLRPKETIKDEEASRSPTIDEHGHDGMENNNKDPLGLTGGKKTGSRRNAWGNLSYADLITKAIQGTVEKRLTLSQIYDWMVQNVPYFKDKGDSNSSAGWKNSIRHNLSLHNRFMRIQNEGTGKSSWWVLNPDAKPGKAPRRRATSMDTKAYEKKRGRAKRKAEQLRAAMAGGLSPTQTGSHDFVENGLIPEDATLPFTLSPGDFRDRTSSNASSIGRLSPIQSALEPDLENQVPSMSPLPWQGGLESSYTSQEGFNTETLTESLRDMFVGENDLNGINGDGYAGDSLGLQSNLSTPSPVPQQLSPVSNINGYQGANGVMGSPPPPYPDHLRRSPQQISPPSQMGTTSISTLPSNSLNYSGGSVTQGLPTQDVGGNFMSQSMDVLQNDMYEGILDMLDTQTPPNNSPQPRSEVNQFVQNAPIAPQVMAQQPMPQQIQPGSPSNLTLLQRRQQLLLMLRSQPSESLLRQALTQRTQLALQRQQVVKVAQMTPPQQRTLQQQQLLNVYEQQQQHVHAQLQQQQQQRQQQQHQQQQQIGNNVNGLNVFMNQGVNSEAMELQQSMPTLGNPNLAPLNLPTDLDVSYSEMEAGDINCDVEQVLNLERSFDENLDFNFDQNQQASQSNGDNPYVLQLSH